MVSSLVIYKENIHVFKKQSYLIKNIYTFYSANPEVGAIASPRPLMPYAGKCSTPERWWLWCGRGIWHRDPGHCSFSSPQRATNSSLSSGDSCPLCPPSTGSQGEWLQTISHVGCLRGSHISSRFLSLPGGQTPHWISQPDIGFRTYIISLSHCHPNNLIFKSRKVLSREHNLWIFILWL